VRVAKLAASAVALDDLAIIQVSFRLAQARITSERSDVDLISKNIFPSDRPQRMPGRESSPVE